MDGPGATSTGPGSVATLTVGLGESADDRDPRVDRHHARPTLLGFDQAEVDGCAQRLVGPSLPDDCGVVAMTLGLDCTTPGVEPSGGKLMSPASRCDEIMRLIDEALDDRRTTSIAEPPRGDMAPLTGDRIAE